MTYLDHRDRLWPEVTVAAYRRDKQFWYEYCQLLDQLAGYYDCMGCNLSAYHTRGDAADIRAVIRHA